MMLRPGMYLQDRYEILEQIGSGGMSEVYRAKCHKLNRLVAIKVLKEEFSSDAGFVKKFKMEAQAAAGLSHPNIVSVYDVVDEGSIHYIVMELIEGITLKSYITKKGRLGSKEAIGIALQVAQGIAAAHDQHIVHRDIKPQNMIISRDGKVKVADFGIARAVTTQTIGATAVGSVHYISPEQARGGFSDSRTDIYSLGITMYEMVTGTVPFDGDNTVSIALAHLEQPITPPSRLNPEVPVSLERIIMKCTQKKPEKRYADVYELISDLRHALVDPDDDFVAQEPEVDTSSPTMVISGDELSQIKSAPRRSTGPIVMSGQSNSLRDVPGSGGQHERRGDREHGYDRRKEPESGRELKHSGYDKEYDRDYERGRSGGYGRQDAAEDGRSLDYDYEEDYGYDRGRSSGYGGSGSSRTLGGKKGGRGGKSADVNPQIEKLLTTVGVAVAIIIVAVLVVIFAKLGGIFNSGSHTELTLPAVESGESDSGLKDTETRVPDFVGMTEDEAEEKAKENHLKLSYSYTASEEEKKGLVVEQKTEEGTVVDKQSTIRVVVGEGGMESSTEEETDASQIDLTALGLEALDGTNAKNLLEAKGLKVSLQSENSDTIIKDQVIRYEPTSASPGSEIRLYVSSGPAVTMVPVPDLTGKTEEEAAQLLEAAGLTVAPKEQILTQKSDTVSRGKIISQIPLKDEEVPEGSAVSYVVSIGKGTKYVAIVNDDYPLKDNFGPGGASTTITVEIVMVQTVNGQKRTTTVMDAREMKGDVTLPVHYQLTGEDGVLTGELQIRDVTNDRVLKTYPLEFMEVDA
ncbi:protein kinase domain-containing protein [Clostridium sp. M62/1]|uniref:protein kinase domain-containing protein n=1 Tax=Clostridium sp. M62/1 TaxID=411486 RepID=UPI0001972DCA|nr:kinase domain protein [Clostridium sp. M62/1]MBS5468352.1 protein kinase [Clostridium sp.]